MHIQFVDFLSHRLGYFNRFLKAGIPQKQTELFPAIPDGKIAGSSGNRPNGLAYFNQSLIPGKVPQFIVVILEVIRDRT